MVASASLQGAEMMTFLGAAGHVQGEQFAGLEGAGSFDHDVDAVVGPLPFALAAAGDGDLTVVDLHIQCVHIIHIINNIFKII